MKLIILIFLMFSSSLGYTENNKSTVQDQDPFYYFITEQIANFQDDHGIDQTLALKLIDGIYYLGTRDGKIYSFNFTNNKIFDLTLILDISDVVNSDTAMNQDGLLDFNLDNNYKSNGIIYLSYSSKTDSKTATHYDLEGQLVTKEFLSKINISGSELPLPFYNCENLMIDLRNTEWLQSFYSQDSLRIMNENGYQTANLEELKNTAINLTDKSCDEIGFFEVTMFVPGFKPSLYQSKNLFTIFDFYPSHSGGSISFDEDNDLYISLGDTGGPGRDPFFLAQNPKRYEGSVLKITPNTNFEELQKYTIPDSNPFINDDRYLPEIWAYGFRNPFRSYFDKKLDVMILSDVGDIFYEELNIIKKGHNYGWPLKEGRNIRSYIGFMPDEIPRSKLYSEVSILPDDLNRPLSDPLVSRPHSPQNEDINVSCALTAVKYISSKKYKSLMNSIINIDWCGAIYSTKFTIEKGEFIATSDTKILSNIYGITDIVEKNDGTIVLLSYDGNLFSLNELSEYRNYSLDSEVSLETDKDKFLSRYFISGKNSGSYLDTRIKLSPQRLFNLDSESFLDTNNCFLAIKYAVAGENNFIEIDGEKFFGYKSAISDELIVLNFNRGIKKIKVSKNNLNNPLEFNLGFFVNKKNLPEDARIEEVKFLCSI